VSRGCCNTRRAAWRGASLELTVINMYEELTSAIGFVRAWGGDMSALCGLACVKNSSAQGFKKHADGKGN